MIKSIIAKGIGFSPGSVSYIPTHGFDPRPGALTDGAPLRFYPAAESSMALAQTTETRQGGFRSDGAARQNVKRSNPWR